ncbi:MAG: asparagine synthase-related protein [Mobilitalea sp.]
MSAIFGILHLDGTQVEEKHLKRMQRILDHYGVDATELHIEQGTGLGCCLHRIGKYSIRDTPLYQNKEKKLILVGDALIYNREELIRNLFRTEKGQISTQELLVKAYLTWGENCGKYLNGDFAFAIWEEDKERLLLFRDQLGVRPLYYCYKPPFFAFATDYRALLALPGVNLELDEVKLYSQLSDTYHIDTERTFFSDVKRLPQAHLLKLDATEIQLIKYWMPGTKKRVRLRTEEDYKSELYRIVEDSLVLRIKFFKEKICSEFSGGLDSSVITIMANRELKKKKRELEAYSWSPGYELLQKQKKDEREVMLKVCKKEGFECDFRSYYLTPQQELRTRPALTDGQRSEEHRQILQEISLQGNSLILSGWGGDEGISHRADIYELLFHRHFICFLKEAEILSRGSLLRLIKLILLSPFYLLSRPYSFLGGQNNKIPNIMNKVFEKKIKPKCKKDILHFKTNPIKHMESGVSVSRSELMAWVSADYQLQYVFPFLDYRVIDFALSIPRHWYYKKGISRYIYRKAFEEVLPKELCYHRGKIDVAREVFWKENEKLQQKAELALEVIDKDRFINYLDWDKVKELVKQKYFETRTREATFTLYKLLLCYDIQRIILEAENIRKNEEEKEENEEVIEKINEEDYETE